MMKELTTMGVFRRTMTLTLWPKPDHRDGAFACSAHTGPREK
jgi:hypothetical protein